MKQLSNMEIYDRLHQINLIIGKDGGATNVGDSALRSLRKIVVALQLALVAADEGVIWPADKPSET